MNATRRQVMMAAGSAVLAGCATPIGDPDWQQFSAGDGTRISYRRWLPASTPKTVLQVVHGAAEHSSRYDRFAKLAVASGYAVYATDHREKTKSSAVRQLPTPTARNDSSLITLSNAIAATMP